jgi:ribosomal protein S1
VSARSSRIANRRASRPQLDALRGQELRMRVIKVNERGNIVLFRKALLEEENAEKKKHTPTSC